MYYFFVSRPAKQCFLFWWVSRAAAFGIRSECRDEESGGVRFSGIRETESVEAVLLTLGG